MKRPKQAGKATIGLVVAVGLLYAGLGLFAVPAYAGLCTPQACVEAQQDATDICNAGHEGLSQFVCQFPGGIGAHYVCGDGSGGFVDCGN